MIVVHTNVILEAMRPQPDTNVMAWLNEQAAGALYISIVTEAALMSRVAVLQEGEQRQRLAEAVESCLAAFEDRVLPIDRAIGRQYAQLAPARNNGLSMADSFIAATAIACKFKLAACEAQGITAAGIEAIDPSRGKS